MNLLDQELPGQLYEAPLEDAPWLGFVGLLRQRMNVASCSVHFRLPSEV